MSLSEQALCRSVFSKQLVFLLQQLVQCILATCTLCCYNQWFCCLHATIVLLLACFHGSASYRCFSSAACMLQFCCLHASVLLLACFSSAACMLQFCCLHASMVLLLACFHGSAASMLLYIVLLLPCYNGSAACMLPWFCCFHASKYSSAASMLQWF